MDTSNMTIHLKHPVTIGETTYSEVTFTRPTFTILRLLGEASKKSEGHAFLMAISHLTGLPNAAIDKLDLEDFEAFKEKYEALVGKHLSAN